jgi:hypothetical protein
VQIWEPHQWGQVVVVAEGGDGGRDGCRHNDPDCRGGGGGSGGNHEDDTVLGSSGPHIGVPTDAGDYITGYNGFGGGLSQNGISSVGGDGECLVTSPICVFSGGSVPLRYGASYDVNLEQKANDLMA